MERVRLLHWQFTRFHTLEDAIYVVRRAPVDVAFSLEQNQFNGETYLELTICDIRPAGSSP